MKQKLAKLLLMYISFTYGIIIGELIAEPVQYKLVWPNLIKQSYIRSISGTKDQRYTAWSTLQQFNMPGHKTIIKTNGTRPVTIEIRKLDLTIWEKTYGDNVLGYTISSNDSAAIYIRDDLGPETFKEVLLHEMLHAFGYGHSLDKRDIMYYAYSNLLDKTTFLRYIKEIEERISD